LCEFLNQSVRINRICDELGYDRFSKDKFSAVDVFAEDRKGKKILIKLQFFWGIDYLNLLRYNGNVSFFGYPQYPEIEKIYFVTFIHSEFEERNDYLYHSKMEFKSLDHDDILSLSEKQYKIICNVDAEHYLVKINNFNDEIIRTLDEWIYFLKHNRIKDGFSCKGLLKMCEILDYSLLSPEEKADYDNYQSVRNHILRHNKNNFR
jgi:hypothetical protein